jgi:hypothetical protein
MAEVSSMATKKVPTKARSATKKTAKPAKKPAIAQKVSKTRASKSVERKPASPTPVADKLAAIGIDGVCEALTNGKTMTAIAQEAKVSVGSLLAWIAADTDRSARAREARIQAAKVWDEQALNLITAAKDQFQLAKARESAQHLRWRASKIAPKEYGDKLAVGQADDLLPLVTVKDLTGRKD